MAIFTENVCLDWLNEEALYEQLFSKEDFENAIKNTKSIVSQYPEVAKHIKYSTISKYNEYVKSVNNGDGKYGQNLCIAIANGINPKLDDKILVQIQSKLRTKQKYLTSYGGHENPKKYKSWDEVPTYIVIQLHGKPKPLSKSKSSIPQEIKDAIKRIKELDKKYRDKYKSDCYGRFEYPSADDINESIECNEDPHIAVCDVRGNVSKAQNMSGEEYDKYVNDKWSIFNKMFNELNKNNEFGCDDDDYELSIYYKMKK